MGMAPCPAGSHLASCLRVWAYNLSGTVLTVDLSGGLSGGLTIENLGLIRNELGPRGVPALRGPIIALSNSVTEGWWAYARRIS